MPQPTAVYRDLLAKREGTVDGLRERFRRLGNFRLGFFVIRLIAMIAVSAAIASALRIVFCGPDSSELSLSGPVIGATGIQTSAVSGTVCDAPY